MGDWIDMKSVISGLVGAAISGIFAYFLGKRQEQRHQSRPELEQLWDSLQGLEGEVNDFAGEKAIELLNKHIIKREEGEILDNVNGCGGALSFTGIGLEYESPQFSLYVPQWVKEGIKRIENLQKELRLNVKDFNKRWPSGPTLKTLKERNGSKISDEALEIGKKADFLKKQVIKLKQDIENELGKKWWCP